MPPRNFASQSTLWMRNRWPSWSNCWRIASPQELRIIATVSYTYWTWPNICCCGRITWRGSFQSTSTRGETAGWSSARDSTRSFSSRWGTFTSPAILHWQKLCTSCGTSVSPAWSPWLCAVSQTLLSRQTFSGTKQEELYIYITIFINYVFFSFLYTICCRVILNIIPVLIRLVFFTLLFVLDPRGQYIQACSVYAAVQAHKSNIKV